MCMAYGCVYVLVCCCAASAWSAPCRGAEAPSRRPERIAEAPESSVNIHIYIYIERERYMCTCMCVYIYIYIYQAGPTRTHRSTQAASEHASAWASDLYHLQPNVASPWRSRRRMRLPGPEHPAHPPIIIINTITITSTDNIYIYIYVYELFICNAMNCLYIYIYMCNAMNCLYIYIYI